MPSLINDHTYVTLDSDEVNYRLLSCTSQFYSITVTVLQFHLSYFQIQSNASSDYEPDETEEEDEEVEEQETEEVSRMNLCVQVILDSQTRTRTSLS